MKFRWGVILFVILLCASSVSAITDFVDLDEYLIEYEYDDATAGERLTLVVTITNQDDETREDIEFVLDDNSVLDIIGDDEFEIDSLSSYESKKKSFRLEVDALADSDDYELEFELEDDEDDYEDIIVIEVDSIVPELIVGGIESSPSVIVPETDDIKLDLVLENIGDGEARFVRAKLKLPNGFEPSGSYSDIANLGTIEAGEGKDVTFFIDSLNDLDEGLSQGVLELVYEDEDDNQRTQNLIFDLPVKGKPLFEVTDVSLSPSKLVPGVKADLRVTIKNIGSEDGEETSVRVFENSDQPFEFDEKTNFVGTLDEGALGTAVFSFEVADDASANSYLLKIQTRTVNEGSVLVEEKTIPIKVSKGEAGISFGLIGFLVLIIILVVIIITVVARKKAEPIKIPPPVKY